MNNTPISSSKDFKICDVLGGLDVTRLVSTNARNFFQSAIDDVELMREYLTEVATGGSPSGVPQELSYDYSFGSIEEMSQTLDWIARDLPEGTTTVQAGVGYTDDREDRRIDRFVSTFREPLVGDKETDFRFLDSLSPLLPWIVDRKAKHSSWWKDHQNGISQGSLKEPFLFDSLYTAAWAVSWCETVLYYPPLNVYGHPLTMGDVVGEAYDSHGDAFVVPNLPQNNPQRRASFTAPYPDVALEGLALITATAPVYYTGSFRGYQYNQTFMASLGVDIQVSAVSAFLDALQDSLTPHSFGLIVDGGFNTVVVSQTVVQRIYPPRTGFEESRVTYDRADGSIVQDRRNVTYLPSDTILQDLTSLTNADWKGLQRTVRAVPPGQRDFATLNITLTGDTHPTPYYVLFETWPHVADWTLLVFASQEEVENAINVQVVHSSPQSGKEADSTSATVTMEGTKGVVLEGSSRLVNEGSLDVKVALSVLPDWIELIGSGWHSTAEILLKAGESLPVDYRVSTDQLTPGTQSDSIVLEVQDADYPDCFFREPLSIPLTVQVKAKECGSDRIADAQGNCICAADSVAVGGGCMAVGAFAASIVLPFLALSAVVLYLCVLRKRRVEESIFEVDPDELEFGDPRVTLGKGSFGEVFLAEFRGTKVAVKTIRTKRKKEEAENFVATVSQGCADLEQGLSKTARSAPEPAGPQSQEERPQSVVAGSNTSNHSSLKRTGSRLFSNTFGSSTQLTPQQTKQRSAFIKEMHLLSKLRHPNITMYMGGVIQQGGEPMLILEYMERGSLYDLVRSDDVKIDGELLQSLLQDITQGVRFLHNAKPMVVHGDLKSQNILIDNKMKAKVTDFGLTAMTPFFMSPELFDTDEPIRTTASDVYALGILLYEMYAKQSPFPGEDPIMVLRQVVNPGINRRPPVPDSMKPGVSAMMHDCLLRFPDERPTIAELANRINRFQPEDVEYKTDNEKIPVGGVGFLHKQFPAEVASALLEGKAVQAQAHPSVTVLCATIVDFAVYLSEMEPMKVAVLLQRLFDKFESLAEKHKVFQVDIRGGGSWMGATNCITDQSTEHAKRMAFFAMDLMRAAGETYVDTEKPELGLVEIQVAMHVGPVVGNVVGTVSPRYALSGDTIRTATFLASQAEPGAIACSEQCDALLDKQDPEIPRNPSAIVEGDRHTPVFLIDQDEWDDKQTWNAPPPGTQSCAPGELEDFKRGMQLE